MITVAPILAYKSPERPPPRNLTLEEADGIVRVSFTVMPTWVYVLDIAMTFTVGLIKAAGGIAITYAAWRLVYRSGPPPNPGSVALFRFWATRYLLLAVASAWFWWIFAAYKLRRYRHWGRVPRVLTASAGRLVLTRLGWWRMRERTWPADEIAGIELRRIRGNLNWKRTVADLYIRRHKGRPLRFRLSSSDSALPGQIAERIASAIGRALVTR